MTPRLSPLLLALAFPLAAGAQQDTPKSNAQRSNADRSNERSNEDKPKDAKARFGSRAELDAHYEKEFQDVDRRRIADLAALAPTLKDAEAEATYNDLFNLAVTRDQYEAAEPAALAFLKSGKGTPQSKALASFVNIIASGNRGEYDEAVNDLDLFLKGAATNDPKAPKLDPNLTFAVGEAFVQRLIRAREYDVARRVCKTFVTDSAEPMVKEHFAARLDRIERLGKPAPDFTGTDVDGKKISLADYKGKVVLVDFWASYAPPCVAQLPYYTALRQKYGDRGFEVIGINVDAANQGVREKDRVAPALRRFLLQMRIGWPNIVDGTGKENITQAFNVTDVPANFLIGRDGKVLAVELSDVDLDKAIAKAVEKK